MADLTTTADVDAFLDAADKAAMRAAMDLGTAATTASTDYATAAQGSTADSTASSLSTHVSNTSNPHSVTKAQVGLTNVTDHAQTQASVVPNTAPSAGQLLVGNAGGTAYAPVSASGDATLASTGVIIIANDAVTNTKAANMAASTIKARKTGSTGDPEDCTLSEVLDFIGSAAQGDILYRGASAWARLAAGTSGQFLKTLGAGANPAWASHELRIPIFFSDQTTDWSTGTKITFTWRFGNTTLSSTPIDCVTAPTGSAAQFDVKKNGTTIYSTKPTIDAGETSTDTAATAAVLSTTSLANGNIVTIIIDQVGSTIKGQGGVITFVGTTIP